MYYGNTGVIYNGNWEKDMCRGLGVSTWALGNRHEGQYKDDKRNGTGVYTNADG